MKKGREGGSRDTNSQATGGKTEVLTNWNKHVKKNTRLPLRGRVGRLDGGRGGIPNAIIKQWIFHWSL